MQLVAQKVDAWLSQGRAPYLFRGRFAGSRPVVATHSEYPRTQRQISEARSIDCINPERELELLFRDVVRGLSDQEERRGRIDHIVLKCLGTLASQFESGESRLCRKASKGHASLFRNQRDSHGWGRKSFK